MTSSPTASPPGALTITLLLSGLLMGCGAGSGAMVASPDGSLSVEITINEENEAHYSVRHGGTTVLEDSRLGLIRSDQDFADLLELRSVSPVERVEDRYSMRHGKQVDISYVANRRVFHLVNESGNPMDLIVQVSDDGVAFRYRFPDESPDVKRITDEITAFHFPEGTRAWIQPMSAAKSGWAQVHPSYEEYYEQDVRLDSLRAHEPGWVYPALFQTGSHWILISETAPDRDYAGTRLKHLGGSFEMDIGFPQDPEVFPGGPLNPQSTLPWQTPWRILAVGEGLATIVESTLGTDLAAPSVLADDAFVKPGRAAWSWALLKDGSVNYAVQKRFIDFAAEMGWEYCLIDVNWDTTIGYEGVAELAAYARERGVGVFLWYNSSGDWNTTTYHPKSELLTAADRERVFSRLSEMGVAGVKVDFFGGDGQSVMSYYQDIFEDAARHGLLVNCHGSTLPRGWQRTYPNLLTMESVKGFEFVTFEQGNADRQPTNAAMLPYARNVFDPMDYTPVVLGDIPGPVRRVSTNGFELALSVIFQSGVQHYAVLPETLERVPDFVRDLLAEIPATWEETRFVDGYPGKWVVLARRTGDTWYVAGVNGTGAPLDAELALPFLEPGEMVLVTDDLEPRSFRRTRVSLPDTRTIPVSMKTNGGFVLRVGSG